MEQAGKKGDTAMANRKQKLTYLLIVFALVAWSLLGMWTDGFDITLWADSFKSYSGLYNGRDYSYHLKQPYHAGIFSYGFFPDLSRGSYDIVFKYSADEPGNRLAIAAQKVQPEMLVEGAVSPAFHIEHELPAGKQQEIIFTFLPKEPFSFAEMVTLYGGRGAFVLHSLQIRSHSRIVYMDHLFLAIGLLFLGMMGYYYLFCRRVGLGETFEDRMDNLLPMVFILFLAVLTSYPILTTFLPIEHTHDAQFHLLRLRGLAAGMVGGQFPVRHNPVMRDGLGYGVSLFYPDVFLWPSALLQVAGVSALGSYFFLIFSINLLTAAIAYHVGMLSFKKRWPAAVFCLLYSLAFYRMNNVYLRHAVGESIAMTALPLVVYGLYAIFLGRWKHWPYATIGFATVLLSHILSTLMVVILGGLFGLCCIGCLWREKKRMVALLKAAGITLLLCLFFLLPMMDSGRYINMPAGKLWDSALLNLAELVMVFTGFGVAVTNDTTYFNAMPMSMGFPLLLSGVVAFVLLIAGKKSFPNKFTSSLAQVSLSFGIFCLLLCSSSTIWWIIQKIPVVSSLTALQFAWRFLGPASCFFALCGGAVATAWKPSFRQGIGVVCLLVFCCLLQPAYMIDDIFHGARDTYTRKTNVRRLESIDNFYMTSLAQEKVYLLSREPLEIKNESPDFLVIEQQKKGSNWTVQYQGAAGAIVMPVLWYEGFRATDENGTILKNESDERGLIRILPQGDSGTIFLRYVGMGWWRIGDVISLATLVGCCVMFCWRRKTGRSEISGK